MWLPCRSGAAALPALTAETAPSWEDILLRNEDLSRRMSHLSSYVSCLASSDARNEAYLKEEAELTRTRAELAKVRIELLRAVKPTPDDIFAAFVATPAVGRRGELFEATARGSAARHVHR